MRRFSPLFLLICDWHNVRRQIWMSLDWFAGGQHLQFEERVESFVGRFRNAVSVTQDLYTMYNTWRSQLCKRLPFYIRLCSIGAARKGLKADLEGMRGAENLNQLKEHYKRYILQGSLKKLGFLG